MKRCDGLGSSFPYEQLLQGHHKPNVPFARFQGQGHRRNLYGQFRAPVAAAVGQTSTCSSSSELMEPIKTSFLPGCQHSEARCFTSPATSPSLTICTAPASELASSFSMTMARRFPDICTSIEENRILSMCTSTGQVRTTWNGTEAPTCDSASQKPP